MEKRSKVQGRFVDDLGWYNLNNKSFDLDKEKAKYWISVGAQPTDSVHNLLVKSGTLLNTKKKPVHGKSKQKKEENATVQNTAQPAENQKKQA